MKVGILAGGLGSRLSEETAVKPKPMVEIGGHPMLWHIMMYYRHFGFDEFAIALGYRGDVIKEHIRVNRSPNRYPMYVELVETGDDTQTGGRIKRMAPYLGPTTFMLTWGDGLSTVDLKALLSFHRAHGRIATVTAVRPPARFGALTLKGDQVVVFEEKPQLSEGWINGAFFVLEPRVFDFIDGDATHFEHEPLERLAEEGQLMAYRHHGFWQCMDTLRDKHRLEELWATGNAPWKVWD